MKQLSVLWWAWLFQRDRAEEKFGTKRTATGKELLRLPVAVPDEFDACSPEQISTVQCTSLIRVARYEAERSHNPKARAHSKVLPGLQPSLLQTSNEMSTNVQLQTPCHQRASTTAVL